MVTLSLFEAGIYHSNMLSGNAGVPNSILKNLKIIIPLLGNLAISGRAGIPHLNFFLRSTQWIISSDLSSGAKNPWIGWFCLKN